MKLEDLKYVVGEAHEAQPAYMRLYGHINETSTQRFNEEFLWLQDVVKPSKIVICINSEGGSVLYGMGTFSIIQNSSIEVETIVEGMAASMASVIWAAGTRSYMRDYSILMIHNPFIKASEASDPDTAQTVAAFQQQIEMVYHRRFGLSKSKIREIMDGKEGCDGTYFTAKQAVEAGILPAENIIKTSKQVCNKVQSQIEGLTEACEIQKIMASINMGLDIFKPLTNPDPIHKQNQIENSNSQTMEQNKELSFGDVCAQLGMQKETGIESVMNRITELKNAETNLKALQASFNELRIQKEGAEAQLTNVTNELADVKNQLQAYKDAEQAQRDAAIVQFIDNAIAENKIAADAKEKWVEMAKTNFELVQANLNTINPSEKISEKIANDPSNVENAEQGLTDAEKRMKDAVEAAVGKDFKFQTLAD